LLVGNSHCLEPNEGGLVVSLHDHDGCFAHSSPVG
jgi:hypothetical protein